MATRVLLTAMLALLSLGSAEPARAEVRIYRPAHRLAAELAPVAQGILAPLGSAVVDPGSGALVLRGERQAIEQALGVLRQLDVGLASFQIETRTTRASELSRRGFSLSGALRLGDLLIGSVPDAVVEGLLLQSDAQNELSSRSQVSMVTVREGSTADLWTGSLRHLPASPERHGQLGADLAASRSGLRVRPHSLEGDLIELQIHSIVARDRLENPISETGLATRITVREGVWTVLGGIDSSRRETRGGLAEAGRLESADSELLLVRVKSAQ